VNISIITRTLPPHLCGIGDYSICFANALRCLGHQLTIIAGQGDYGEDKHIIKDDWSETALSNLLCDLEKMPIDHLTLQYTPLAFSTGDNNHAALVNFWTKCGQRWKTCLIVHEAYFRVWWYPPSWLRGSIQKYILRSMVKKSHRVFSASHPLVEEINAWTEMDNVTLLPIGSNIDVHCIDREQMRDENQIGSNDLVLTIFGGGTALKWLSSYVNNVDTTMRRHRIPIRWLLLGGVPEEWFGLEHPVVMPGWLSPEALSAWLQLTDIFLVPHKCGLTAKRGTLMAALRHGLPVVGTRGFMTDQFWVEVPGVTLTSMPGKKRFSAAVLNLATDPKLRKIHGNSNQDYFQQCFTWEKIAQTFLQGIH
jgi:glycosyltransferase involved in cell wall biosynthesis